MSWQSSGKFFPHAAVLFAAAAIAAGAAVTNPQVQERLAELKQAATANKEALSHYTWQDQQTVSVKGEVKKQELYNVRLGPDGKPQKTLISSSAAPPQAAGRGPLRHHIVEHKKEEFETYAKQVAALAQTYAQPNPQKLQQAFERGDVKVGSAGAPGEYEITILNYNKPNDSVRYTFNREQHAIQQVHVDSYLSKPSDAVTMDIQFAKLPDGTNHVSQMMVNGVAKQLTVTEQNSNYVKS